MTKKSTEYDWAAAALSVELCNSTELNELVNAADLDPFSGDVADIDLSDMDLRNQNMSGWDLQHASFKNARVAKANFKGSKIDPESFINASDWNEAQIDEELRTNALFSAIRRFPVNKLEISISTFEFLESLNVKTIGDLMEHDEEAMSLSDEGEPKNILELKEVLDPFRVVLVDSPSSVPAPGKKYASDQWMHVTGSEDLNMEQEIIDHMKRLYSNVQLRSRIGIKRIRR